MIFNGKILRIIYVLVFARNKSQIATSFIKKEIVTDSFYFLEGSNQKEKKLNHIENWSYMPVMVRHFGNKILLFENRDSFNVFLQKKNKTITKFE